MRDNSNIELCRALCQSFAAGPGTANSTKSLPLHFASKRWKPNKELLKLLIRRNPGAASVFNEFGYLPLHCACATTDDLEAVRMIYDAYPEAITMKDRQVESIAVCSAAYYTTVHCTTLHCTALYYTKYCGSISHHSTSCTLHCTTPQYSTLYYTIL